MIKSINQKPRELSKDLTGPEGNAFCLLAYAKSLSKQLSLDFKQIQVEMMSGDYENLVNVFEKNFGEYVTLYR